MRGKIRREATILMSCGRGSRRISRRRCRGGRDSSRVSIYKHITRCSGHSATRWVVGCGEWRRGRCVEARLRD